MILPTLRQLILDASRPGNVTGYMGDRAFVGNAPQDERRSRIIINLLNEDYPQVMSGASDYITGTAQVACLAETAEEADRIARAARACLDGYEGPGTETIVKHLEVQSADALERAPLEGKAAPTFGVALTVAYMLEDTN